MTIDRINALKTKIKENKLDAYYLNTSDFHMSEYVPEYFKTIRYFSGFSGSLATLMVDAEKAYIFVDGRYHIQADRECQANGIEVVKLGTKDALDPISFIKKNYQDKTIGLDARRTSISFAKKLVEAGAKIKSLDIYSELIDERATLSSSPLKSLDIEYTGKTRKEKLDELRYCFKDKVHIINNLESIAYLLNMRGNDIIYTPVFMSYMIIDGEDVYLFIDINRLDANQLEALYLDDVIIKPYEEYYEVLKTIKNKTVVLDENKVNYETYLNLKDNHNTFVNMRSVVEDMKAVKNDKEIANTKLAHTYDGVSMVRFIKWLKESDKTKLTEWDASEYLNNLRLNNHAFDLSFNSIVAYNENAASMHYSPSKDRPVQLTNSGILLVDSGGQYLEGTTDITRTISLGENSAELKKHFTLVLKSMFNLSSAKFLEGMSGQSIDILARINIWKEGIDYRCGTGHGVGHILSVHENPPRISFSAKTSEAVEPLKPGQITSDEPGIYLEGKYGIRCENEILVKKDELNEYGQFLSFETITLCPFDLDLIDINYLNEDDIKLLNDYHKKVYDTLSPYLNEEEKEFLKKETRLICKD